MILIVLGIILAVYVLGMLITTMTFAYQSFNLETDKVDWEDRDVSRIMIWPVYWAFNLCGWTIGHMEGWFNSIMRRVYRSKRIMHALEK